MASNQQEGIYVQVEIPEPVCRGSYLFFHKLPPPVEDIPPHCHRCASKDKLFFSEQIMRFGGRPLVPMEYQLFMDFVTPISWNLPMGYEGCRQRWTVIPTVANVFADQPNVITAPLISTPYLNGRVWHFVGPQYIPNLATPAGDDYWATHSLGMMHVGDPMHYYATHCATMPI